MPNIHAPRTKTKKQVAAARKALEKRLALWDAGIDPDTGKKIAQGPRGRKRARKRNGESFRQTGGIHIDIGSDIKGRGAIKNPIKAGYSKTTVSENIAKLMREGRKQKQAVAIAIHSARQHYRKKYPRGAYPHWLAKMVSNPTPKRGSVRGDAYALCRAALKAAHDARGSLIAKQAAVSYAQGMITACAKLGALPPADVRLYSEALCDIVKG